MFSDYQTVIPNLRTFEQFNDTLIRMFPELFSKKLPDGSYPGVMTITFQVTDACNLRCTYCYQVNKGVKVMPIGIGKKAIDELLSDELEYCNTKRCPAIVMDFIGGEPLLAIDEIKELYEYFLTRAIELQHPWAIMHYMSISTNGVLYFEEKVQKFLHRYRQQIGLSITLDGNKELHDACRVFPDGSPSYDIVIKGIQDWMKKNPYLGSKITIAPENVEYLYTAIKHMVELGYYDINANAVFEQPFTTEHATTLYNQLKLIADYFIENELYFSHYFRMFDHSGFAPLHPSDNKNWCGGNGQMLAIDPNGNYYPCLRFMESSLGSAQTPFKIGEVGKKNLARGEYEDKVACLSCITRRSQSTDECFNCPVARGCGWCTAYNYQEFGTADKRATHICCMHKATSLANAYYWNKLFQKFNVDLYFEMFLPEKDAIEIIGEQEYLALKTLSNGENKFCVNPAAKSGDVYKEIKEKYNIVLEEYEHENDYQ